MTKEAPRTTDWTCQLLIWHGFYQHPSAKDKNRWYVHPEHAIAENGALPIDEWADCGCSLSYTADIISTIFESDQQIEDKDKVFTVCCCYECSYAWNAEEGDTCLMMLLAEDGPKIDGLGGILVDYVGVFHEETRQYVWHPRTSIDEALVARYFHHVPSQEELRAMCCEGRVFRLDT